MASKTDFESTVDSGRVLDLPHALGKAFDANAAAVLHLVSGVRDDVLRRDGASDERRKHSRIKEEKKPDAADRRSKKKDIQLMGPEEIDGDSLLVAVHRLTDL